jgi:hypothetical protein
MKKTRTHTILLIVFLALTAGCDQSNKASSTRSGPVDGGTFSAGSFTSDYFDFSLTFPQHWQSVDRQAIRQAQEQFLTMLTSHDSQLQQEMRAGLERTHYLLAVAQPTPGPHGFAANLSCTAEEVRSQGIRTPQAYLDRMKGELQRLNMPLTFAGESRTGKVGNREFLAQGMQMQMPGLRLQQFVYITLIDDHALCFTLSYTNSTEFAELQRAFQSLNFH